MWHRLLASGPFLYALLEDGCDFILIMYCNASVSCWIACHYFRQNISLVVMLNDSARFLVTVTAASGRVTWGICSSGMMFTVSVMCSDGVFCTKKTMTAIMIWGWA